MGEERLSALRALMKERGIDIYIVPTADFHESEYVGEYFKARRFLTGFTGSAGVAVVTMDEAGLWTDGRYFIQAAREIEGSGFTLFKMAVKGVPTTDEFVRDNLPVNGVIGFDGRCVNAAWGKKLRKIAETKAGRLETAEDLVGRIWTDRPPLPHEKSWVLEEKYAGESVSSKLGRIRAKMAESDVSVHIMTSLDDIAWTLNIRGNDIIHFPVVLSYLIITKKGCVWYVDPECLTDDVKAHLQESGVTAAPYGEFYQMVEKLGEKEAKVLMDSSKVNYRIYDLISAACTVVDQRNPAYDMKARKNIIEQKNLKIAHIKDGIAMVKWICWLKNNIGKLPLNEYNVSERLGKYRAALSHYVDLSFNTIMAYGPNAAMMHYSATKDNYAELRAEGFLLCDSGAHYLEGSTDITRTIALGPLTEEEKRLYTVVLRSNLGLASAKFLYGCSGLNLDILARGPLWELGIDYRCGTGHGVGYMLNIHEGPNGFRYKVVPERNDSAVLEEGMVTTDEPGVYTEGVLGIRLENELLCRRDEENEYGQFMSFEPITYCPFDLDAVNADELSGREKTLLNAYHKTVYDTLSPYLTEEEKDWLKNATREV